MKLLVHSVQFLTKFKTFNEKKGDPVDLEDEERVDILRGLSIFAQKGSILVLNPIFLKSKKHTTKYNFKEHKNLGLVLANVQNNPNISFEEFFHRSQNSMVLTC